MGITGADTEAAASSPKLFRCGTLTYTRMGLFGVFAWMLWGDFVFTLMEDVWPQILPLFLLKGIGMSPGTAILIRTTIPQIIGFFACPIISFKSDRCRSKWGRRIPYMILTAPLLSLFLGALGFSGDIVGWLNYLTWPQRLGLSPAATMVIVVGFLGAGFNFFNEFVDSVYWYLFNDVVPKPVMGQFLGWFRAVGGVAHILFGLLVFPYALSHTKWIFLGGAGLYVVGFGLMCWRMKEGQYPPVTDVGVRTPMIDKVELFFKDCLTHPIYIALFAAQSLGEIGGLAGIGGQVFILSLGITLTQQGIVGSIQRAVSILLQVPCGWLVDRIHPIRVILIFTVISGIVMPILQYFFLWTFRDYCIFAAAGLVFGNIAGAAGIPLLMRVFPEAKYGQFCSANGAMRSVTKVLFAIAAIPFVDWISNYGTYEAGYRLAFLWSAAFAVASWLCMVGVFIYWRRLGGDKGYMPPLKHTVTWEKSEAEMEEAVQDAPEAAPACLVLSADRPLSPPDEADGWAPRRLLEGLVVPGRLRVREAELEVMVPQSEEGGVRTLRVPRAGLSVTHRHLKRHRAWLVLMAPAIAMFSLSLFPGTRSNHSADADTAVTVDGRPAALADLAPGMRVEVRPPRGTAQSIAARSDFGTAEANSPAPSSAMPQGLPPPEAPVSGTLVQVDEKEKKVLVDNGSYAKWYTAGVLLVVLGVLALIGGSRRLTALYLRLPDGTRAVVGLRGKPREVEALLQRAGLTSAPVEGVRPDG